jgi:hypothetical protein
MFQRKPSRFRRRPNGRSHRPHGSGSPQRSHTFTNGQPRNSFKPSMSAEKMYEKYSSLAKESMSTGDKTLSENYLQHADHFMRVIEEKNRNRNQNKVNTIDKSVEDSKNDSTITAIDAEKDIQAEKNKE